MSKEIKRLKKNIDIYLNQILHYSAKEPKNWVEIKHFENLMLNAIRTLEIIEDNIKPTLSARSKIKLIEIIENKNYDYLDTVLFDEKTIEKIKKKGGNTVLVKDNLKITVSDYVVAKIEKV